MRDVLRLAIINGAKHLRLDHKTGVPGAVVSLMHPGNVEMVIVGGTIRKWKGQLLGVNLSHLRRQLENSRDRIFAAAGVQQDVFGQ